MSKQIKLTLNGQERTFEFGKNWFLKYYGQASGEDPLNTTDILLKPETQFDFVVNALYAGLKTQYKVDKKEFDFTHEDVRDWVGLEDTNFIVTFLTKFAELSKTTTQGEAVAPANGALPGMSLEA